MYHDIMRVTRSPKGHWSVQAGCSSVSLHDFRLKSHAVAYARALSSSRKTTLFIDDESGLPVRQTTQSLTYPIHLE